MGRTLDERKRKTSRVKLAGFIGPGDVKWMTAGSGILPKQYKMTPPKYQTLLDNQMGRVGLPNDGGEVRIIAGELNGEKVYTLQYEWFQHRW